MDSEIVVLSCRIVALLPHGQVQYDTTLSTCGLEIVECRSAKYRQDHCRKYDSTTLVVLVLPLPETDSYREDCGLELATEYLGTDVVESRKSVTFELMSTLVLVLMVELGPSIGCTKTKIREV